MALEPYPGMVPNAYGANTGNVMSFGGGGGAPQVGAPVSGNNDVLGALAVLSILDELGFRDGDGGPGATGGGPDAAAGVTGGGSVGIGIGPASGSPGTGGLGGLAGGMMSVGQMAMGPVGFALSSLMSAITGRTPTAEQVMNMVNSVTGGGNAGPGGPAGGASGMGVAPGSAEAEAQGLGLGTNETGQNTTGAGAGESGNADGGVSSAGGDGPGPGVWKGGPITKDIVRGPKPNKHDDGTTGVKVGEYMLNVKAATKIGKDVLDKLNSGDFDPAMLRFAVLRKVSK